VMKLTTQFQSNGFDFRQVDRRGDVAIFLQSRGGRPVGFEVVGIRVAPPRRFPDGRDVPEREIYPSNEHWGLYGFTCKTLERAKALMHAISECPPLYIREPKDAFLDPASMGTADGRSRRVLQDGSKAA